MGPAARHQGRGGTWRSGAKRNETKRRGRPRGGFMAGAMGAGERVRTGGNGARGRRGGRGRVCVPVPRPLLFLPSASGLLPAPAIFGWRGGEGRGGAPRA